MIGYGDFPLNRKGEKVEDNFYHISGKIDSSKFFELLGCCFKDATTLFIEGTSIAKDVLNIYKDNLQEGNYLPKDGTIFPKSTKLRCKYSLELMNKLASVAESHAGAEMCDHLHIYKNDEPLIEWMDAFSGEIQISKSVNEETVAQFSSQTEE